MAPCSRVLLAALLLWLAGPGLARAQTVPFLQRTGANLAPNPTFNGTSGWALSSGAVYDASASRTADGSGAIKMPLGSQARIDSTLVNVQAGHTYTLSAYIRSNAWPAGNVGLYFFYNGSVYPNTESGAAGNSQSGLYEEIVWTVTPDTTSSVISLVIVRGLNGDTGVGDLWVDEVYFGENLGFGSPPAAKTPFNGQYVHVDPLGNMSVLRSGVYQPFFPFCIYSDGRRPNAWALYSGQGFNCDVWNNSTTIAAASQATSSFNPQGMMSGIQIAQYMWPDFSGWDPNGVNLTNEINAAKATGYADHILWYYWDNENHMNEWNNPMKMLGITETVDTIGGQRQSPIYVLQGSFNLARFYNTAAGHVPTNLTGAYTDATAATGGSGHGAQSLTIEQRLQNQTIPTVVYQANIVSSGTAAGGLRSTLYRGLIVGARGMGLWRDCYLDDCQGFANNVTTVPWWPDVPNLRNELNAMLPLIQQPHWTSWSVAFNSALPIEVGTRDYNGSPHMIILNRSFSPVTVTFTLSGLASAPTSVVNYFTGATITGVSSNQFTMTIPANGVNSGTAVVRLAGGVPGPSATLQASQPTITLGGSSTLTWGSNNTLSCTGSGFSTGIGSPVNGSVSVSPTVTTQYGVDCLGTDNVTHATATATVTVSQPCTTPAVRWQLNEGGGTTVADTGTAGATGTLVGGPTWVAGYRSPAALSFNGVNQYVTNAAYTLPAGSPFTFEVWMKVTAGQNSGTFTIGGTDVDPLGCLILTDNNLYCEYNGAGDPGFAYTPYFGAWTHLAYKGDPARREEYINGALIRTDTSAATPFPAMTRLDLGRITYSVSNIMYMNGQMDDFRLYTCLRSAADILLDAQARPTAPPLLGFFPEQRSLHR